MTPVTIAMEIADRAQRLATEPVPTTEFDEERKEAGHGYLDGLRMAEPCVQQGDHKTLQGLIHATDHALSMWQDADPEPCHRVGMAQTRLTAHLRALKDVLRQMEQRKARAACEFVLHIEDGARSPRKEVTP